MYGNFRFRLNSKRIQYDFQIFRKITKVIGYSGTGKSRLIESIEYSKQPKTGYSIVCDYECEVINTSFFTPINNIINDIKQRHTKHNSLVYAEAMRESLKIYDNKLFFVDEDFYYLTSDNFSSFCKYTDSFFLLLLQEIILVICHTVFLTFMR